VGDFVIFADFEPAHHGPAAKRDKMMSGAENGWWTTQRLITDSHGSRRTIPFAARVWGASKAALELLAWLQDRGRVALAFRPEGEVLSVALHQRPQTPPRRSDL